MSNKLGRKPDLTDEDREGLGITLDEMDREIERFKAIARKSIMETGKKQKRSNRAYRLTPEQTAVVIKLYRDGSTYKQVAQLTKISIGRIEYILNKAGAKRPRKSKQVEG